MASILPDHRVLATSWVQDFVRDNRAGVCPGVRPTESYRIKLGGSRPAVPQESPQRPLGRDTDGYPYWDWQAGHKTLQGLAKAIKRQGKCSYWDFRSLLKDERNLAGAHIRDLDSRSTSEYLNKADIYLDDIWHSNFTEKAHQIPKYKREQVLTAILLSLTEIGELCQARILDICKVLGWNNSGRVRDLLEGLVDQSYLTRRKAKFHEQGKVIYGINFSMTSKDIIDLAKDLNKVATHAKFGSVEKNRSFKDLLEDGIAQELGREKIKEIWEHWHTKNAFRKKKAEESRRRNQYRELPRGQVSEEAWEALLQGSDLQVLLR